MKYTITARLTANSDIAEQATAAFNNSNRAEAYASALAAEGYGLVTLADNGVVIARWTNGTVETVEPVNPVTASPALTAISVIIDGDDDRTQATRELLLPGPHGGVVYTDVDPDMVTTLRTLIGVLAPNEIDDLRASLDLCPMHSVDEAICADDGVVECQEARGVIRF